MLVSPNPTQVQLMTVSNAIASLDDLHMQVKVKVTNAFEASKQNSFFLQFELILKMTSNAQEDEVS